MQHFETQRQVTVTRNGTDTSNPTLAAHVREAVDELKAAFPIAIMTSPNVSKLVAAVETLTYVQKNGFVQARKHVESYKVRIIHKIIVCITQYSSQFIFSLT
jgi:hypothetical protein